MAKYDHGGGCPCGLYAECDPNCRDYIPLPREGTRIEVGDEVIHRVHKTNHTVKRVGSMCFYMRDGSHGHHGDYNLKGVLKMNLVEVQSPALKEIANRIKKLSYRDMYMLSNMVSEKYADDLTSMADALLSVADALETV